MSQHWPSATDVLVMRALLAHGGRIVYSTTIDTSAPLNRGQGRPRLSDEERAERRRESQRAYEARRRAAADRVREVIARHGGDSLDETRRILRERAEARRTAAELAQYGRIAQAVVGALPVDKDAERLVSRMLNERSRGYTSRKLTRKP